MNDFKMNGEKKRYLLHQVQKQRLRSIAILPSLITLINGISGFAAICFASKGNGTSTRFDIPFFAVSGYLIFIAMIADMLDGRIARMSHSTSSFGGQLDSICDIISFGVAPAFLVFNVLHSRLVDLVNPPMFFTVFLQRFIWIAATVYLVCAAIRLARFNVENEEDETSHMDFIGLPTPAAAGVVASLIVLYEDLGVKLGIESRLFVISEQVIMYILPFATIGIAILMISRITYPHVFNYYFKGRKPLTHLMWALVMVALIVWFLQSALVITFCGFAFIGFLRGVYLWKKDKNKNDEPPLMSVTHELD